MSKPTMQEIADALSISRITVWKALSVPAFQTVCVRKYIRRQKKWATFKRKNQHSPFRALAR